jgi:hypothetical protein
MDFWRFTCKNTTLAFCVLGAFFTLALSSCSAPQSGGARKNTGAPFHRLPPLMPAAGTLEKELADFKATEAELSRLQDVYHQVFTNHGTDAAAVYLRALKKSFDQGKIRGIEYTDVMIQGKLYRVGKNLPLPPL